MVEKIWREIAKLDRAIQKHKGMSDISNVVRQRQLKKKQLNALIMMEIPKIDW